MRPGVVDERIEPVGKRMYELATSMPGFVSYADYAGADGESVSVVEFASHETLAAWRKHPEHIAAQELAKEHWFASYRISVCDVVRDYAFPPASPPR
jgi:heme-degrading monooxygenase HmoA